MSRFFKPSLFVIGGLYSYYHRYRTDLSNFRRLKCDEESSLKMALIFFRHGRRTPLLDEYAIKDVIWPEECVKLLPFAEIDCEIKNSIRRPHLTHSKLDQLSDARGLLEGGAPKGVLTVKGQQESYQLGKKLREIYIDKYKLVSPKFSNEEVQLYSTYLKRTLTSMKCVISGMFEIDGNSEKPIIYSRLNEYEYYFPNYSFCYRYKLFHKTALELEDRISRFRLYRKKVAEKIGRKEEELPHPYELHEELSCLRNNDIEIPQEFARAYDYIKDVATKFLVYRMLDTRRLCRKLSCGLAYNDIYEYMDKKILGEKSQSLYLFSVHDTTLISLLKAIDVFDSHWPSCSSYIAFEVHKIDLKPYVRIIYNDKIIDLPNSENGMIHLKDFEKLIEPARIKGLDFLDVCNRGPAQGYFTDDDEE